MIKNLLIFDIGLAYGLPTIVIPALRRLVQHTPNNPPETLHFTAEQSSWYGSIALLTTTVASLVSGWLGESLGRRRTMIVVNVPFIVAWVLLYRATMIEEIFVAGGLLGLGIGLTESAVIAYVGEIR